jgi:hypothetical protein
MAETLADEPPDPITRSGFTNTLARNCKPKPGAACAIRDVEYRKKVIRRSTAFLENTREIFRPGKSILVAKAEYHAARPRARAGPLVT